MKPIETVADFETLRAEPLAIIFKHSTMCPVSVRARREAQKFLESRPEQEIHEVLVIERRDVSDHIQETTGVVHESPQLLVLRSGEVLWHASHFEVTVKTIAAALS